MRAVVYRCPQLGFYCLQSPLFSRYRVPRRPPRGPCRAVSSRSECGIPIASTAMYRREYPIPRRRRRAAPVRRTGYASDARREPNRAKVTITTRQLLKQVCDKYRENMEGRRDSGVFWVLGCTTSGAHVRRLTPDGHVRRRSTNVLACVRSDPRSAGAALSDQSHRTARRRAT